MSDQLSTFQQALSSFSWYSTNEPAEKVLRELDKDLKKWAGEVQIDHKEETARVDIDAKFGGHDFWMGITLCEIGITNSFELPQSQITDDVRPILKLITNARNVLKNFMPVLFDRVMANGTLKLIEIGVSPDSPQAYGIWSVAVEGLCIRYAVMSTEIDIMPRRDPGVGKDNPPWIANIMENPLPRGS